MMDREEALARIEFRVRHACPEANGDNIGECDGCWRYPCNDMKAVIFLAQERPHGEWIDHSDEGYVECPFCGSATNCEDNIDDLHYCFFCGAKMWKEGEVE